MSAAAPGVPALAALNTDPSYRPTKAELEAAVHLTVPDLIAPDLDVLFCGINPGLFTAATGRHFGRPGNRFWPALHASRFTPRLFAPWEGPALLPLGLGITNMVMRTTAAAAELSPEEYVQGKTRLVGLVDEYRPRVVAFLGIGSYRSAFDRKKAALGMQPETIGDTALWALPSPSGLNASYTLADIAAMMRELRAWLNRT